MIARFLGEPDHRDAEQEIDARQDPKDRRRPMKEDRQKGQNVRPEDEGGSDAPRVRVGSPARRRRASALVSSCLTARKRRSYPSHADAPAPCECESCGYLRERAACSFATRIASRALRWSGKMFAGAASFKLPSATATPVKLGGTPYRYVPSNMG